MALLRSAWRCYQRAMAAHPMRTKVASSAALMLCGDCAAQTCIERRGRAGATYDWRRSGRFTALGGLYIAPVVSTWYGVLERFVVGRSRWIPLARVVLDQTIFSAAFLTSLLYILRTIEGKTFAHFWQEYKLEFVPIYLTGLKIWPAAQLVNFYLVPYHYRLVVVQCVALFWNTYISWKTQCDTEAKVAGGDGHL